MKISQLFSFREELGSSQAFRILSVAAIFALAVFFSLVKGVGLDTKFTDGAILVLAPVSIICYLWIQTATMIKRRRRAIRGSLLPMVSFGTTLIMSFLFMADMSDSSGDLTKYSNVVITITFLVWAFSSGYILIMDN